MRKILLLAGVLVSIGVQAQTRFYQFFKRINTLDRPNVCYDYKIQLYNVQTGKAEDSISGRIYKKDYTYLDSSSSALVAVSGAYYYKIDHQRKEATVYDIDLIQKKLNLKLNRQISEPMIVPDSIIVKYGDLTVDTNRGYYTYRWTLKNSPTSALTLVIERGTLRLTRLTLETMETDPEGGPAYKRICTLYNIRNEFSTSVFDVSRFCRINGDKVILNSKYSGYNLKTLIN